MGNSHELMSRIKSILNDSLSQWRRLTDSSKWNFQLIAFHQINNQVNMSRWGKSAGGKVGRHTFLSLFTYFFFAQNFHDAQKASRGVKHDVKERYRLKNVFVHGLWRHRPCAGEPFLIKKETKSHWRCARKTGVTFRPFFFVSFCPQRSYWRCNRKKRERSSVWVGGLYRSRRAEGVVDMKKKRRHISLWERKTK